MTTSPSQPPTLETIQPSTTTPPQTSFIAPPRTHSPTSAARIRTKNRRKRYLDLHPSYFSSGLELADPLAYDRLVRRFQSAAEREAEGRRKGYSGVLEADLWRSEAKIEALAQPASATLSYRRGQDGDIVGEERDEVPQDKEEGLQHWRKMMEMRFLRGDDGDFDYAEVDASEGYDDRGVEEREEAEKWFEEEEPKWGGDEGQAEVKEGETGVQDY